jgi:DNA-binding response OmpR family regulator
MNPFPLPPEDPTRVLVVDDDRRVLELLEVAYSTQGFTVLTAADGDEAYRKAMAEHPDLVVLDVRLPRRSGLEVCEALRREATEGAVPIILVSAMGETEARLQGLASGADDFVPKPFSPKELLARSRRLLARTAESREARRRARDLERELARARDDARRSHLETRREQRLRELAFGLGRELQHTLDLDALALRVADAAQIRLGACTVVLALPARGRRVFEPAALRGGTLERVARFEVAMDGPLAALLRAIGRPARRRQLERIAEVVDELPPLVAGGFVLVAPLAGPAGLEGLIVTDERVDGLEPQSHDLDLLGGLCELSAVALANARRHRAALERAVEVLGDVGASAGARARAAEAAELTARAARAAVLPRRERGLLLHAVALGAAAEAEPVPAALARLEREDATGWTGDLRRLIEAARAPQAPGESDAPETARAALLAAFGRRLIAAREAGEALAPAIDSAVRSLDGVIDPWTAQAIDAAVRGGDASQGEAA